jgi:integrase
MNDKMTPLAVSRIKQRGRHRVSDNLYLQVGEDGRRSWVFRYQQGGRAHMMGLGSYALRTLAEARELAHTLRRQLHLDGVDPLVHRRDALAQAKIEAARAISFQECAAQFLKAHEDNWSSKHRRAWQQTLAQYAYPVLGSLSVQQIGKDEVLRCLDPIWRERPVTAARVRNRIAQVLDWAAARDLRSHDNPATARKLLPKIKRKVEHLAAMPFAKLPDFMPKLRDEPTITARLLEFLILTATRLDEARLARWGEINLADRTFEIPSSRMKTGQPHKVPLSTQAVELLQALPRDGNLVFHHPRHLDRPVHHSAPLKLLQRQSGGNFTVHGTARSAFSTWAHETTSYPNHVIEMSLAHTVGSAVERAYQRSDLFARRRQLMDAWSAFLSAPPIERGDVVVPLARA